MTRRSYESDSIRVTWDTTRCIHVGRCVRGLPTVFDPNQRPWIDLHDADADEVAAIVEECPSGALEYERLDGGPPEELPAVPVIVPRANGPLMVHGEVVVKTAGGDVFTQSGRMTLCRCGASRNQPFCDNTHRDIRFRDNPLVVAPERSAADTPHDIAVDAQPDP